MCLGGDAITHGFRLLVFPVRDIVRTKGMTGPVGYWQVSDIAKNLQSLLDAGAQLVRAVKDVGGGS